MRIGIMKDPEMKRVGIIINIFPEDVKAGANVEKVLRGIIETLQSKFSSCEVKLVKAARDVLKGKNLDPR